MPLHKFKKTDPKFVPSEDRSEVEIVNPDYQPSKYELEEDMRLDATFAEAVDALTKPVRVKYVHRPKSRS